MAGDLLVVLLEGRAIGEIERLKNGVLRLRYDDSYVADASATPMSVSMPSTEQEYGAARITPWLWGLLPDNADVLTRWGRGFSVSTASPYALLGTQVGRDCAGAVQFCSPGDAEALLGRHGDVDWISTEAIAARLRLLRNDSTGWLGPGFAGQFSLAGAQAKTALHRSDGKWGVASGAVPTTHILKPAMAGFEWQDLNEHLCLRAASIVGLRAAASSIEKFEEQTALVVERFDRATHKGSLTRVHQEDLCQALSLYPAQKYQADGGPTPGQIATLIRSIVAGAAAETDVWRFLDALAFNWLIAGTDAHAKNYGLLLAGTQIRLAPLYDIASLLPYDSSDGHEISLAMKIGADYRLHRTDRRSAWKRTAAELKLNRARVLERVLDLANRLPRAFEEAVNDRAVTALATEFPTRLLELVTRRCERCITVLS